MANKQSKMTNKQQQGKPQAQVREYNPIDEMSKAIRCLALELPEPVWKDVNDRWQKVVKSIPTEVQKEENKSVDELAKETIENVLASISGPTGHPLFDTEKCYEIAWFIINDLNTENLLAASPKGKEEEAVEFGKFLSDNDAESLGKDHWRFRQNTTHTTQQLYKLFKQSKGTTG